MVGQFEPAYSLRNGAGVGAFFVAELFTSKRSKGIAAQFKVISGRLHLARPLKSGSGFRTRKDYEIAKPSHECQQPVDRRGSLTGHWAVSPFRIKRRYWRRAELSALSHWNKSCESKVRSLNTQAEKKRIANVAISRNVFITSSFRSSLNLMRCPPDDLMNSG